MVAWTNEVFKNIYHKDKSIIRYGITNGGIMQTEQVPRAHTTGLDGSLTDTSYQHLSPLLGTPLPVLSPMAVKQEPEDEDHRSKTTRSGSNEALNSQLEPNPVTEVTHLHHPGEDNTSVEHSVFLQQQQPESCSSDRTNQDKDGRSRTSRGRRKSRWKLKFHHQALPPEYLDHYEAALAQEALNSPTEFVQTSTPTTSTSTSPVGSTEVQGWLQRIAAMQQELCPRQQEVHPNLRRSVITAHPYSQHDSNNNSSNNNNNNNSNHYQPVQSTRPPMKYSDLPYMGEITLENSKPRRGRKPKKADICHLIYKNYGTILPGTPGHEDKKPPIDPREVHLNNNSNVINNNVNVNISVNTNAPSTPQVPLQRTDIQNRISSLLEKRLTQERRLAGTEEDREQDEPLNLCIKDLNQLKIRLSKKHGVYESGGVKSETCSEDGEDIECLGVSKDRINSTNDSNVNINNNSTRNNDKNLVYWPNGVLINPMTLQSQFLYYQKMGENLNEQKEQKIVPKAISSSSSTASSSSSSPTSPVSAAVPASVPVSPRTKRIAPLGNPLTHQQPTKRKRSAIFIPPMPTENTNNPATEVSICKFKFTGGAKPSLQEKKSLSVDSGGNFRYYSGTGDKSMRGYEFFPRESLQQQASGSAAGTFLNAAGEKIPPPLPSPASSPSRVGNQNQLLHQHHDDVRKKRKTRKSLQREKLEQTFKEKGFLIQTQQLESAEGATYCKFRQLRKFTRYLFRSWKDYLPGNVRDLSGGNPGGEIELPEHEEIDNSSSPLPLVQGMDMRSSNSCNLEQHPSQL